MSNDTAHSLGAGADVDAYAKHATRFGPECVFETAAGDLDPLELGRLSLRLQHVEPRWRLPAAAKDALVGALLDRGVKPADICAMCQISRRTFRKVARLAACEQNRPIDAAFQAGSESAIRAPTGGLTSADTGTLEALRIAA